MDKIIHETATFRVYEGKETIHNGKRYMINVCQELVGGRWEGFVSMKPLDKTSKKQAR